MTHHCPGSRSRAKAVSLGAASTSSSRVVTSGPRRVSLLSSGHQGSCNGVIQSSGSGSASADRRSAGGLTLPVIGPRPHLTAGRTDHVFHSCGRAMPTPTLHAVAPGPAPVLARWRLHAWDARGTPRSSSPRVDGCRRTVNPRRSRRVLARGSCDDDDGGAGAGADDAAPSPNLSSAGIDFDAVSPIDESQFGAPPWNGDGEDPISDKTLLRIVLSQIPDQEVNRLVWEALGCVWCGASGLPCPATTPCVFFLARPRHASRRIFRRIAPVSTLSLLPLLPRPGAACEQVHVQRRTRRGDAGG